MRLLERYLLNQFFRVFVMTFISLMGVYIIADFVTNLGRFLALRDSTDAFGSQLAFYYAARVPWFFEIGGRIVILLSAVFVISTLQKHNEMTALMAAGVSRWQIARPLIISGIVMAVFGIVNREFGLPQFREPLCRSIKDMVQGTSRSVNPRYDNETDVLFNGRAVFLSENRIEEALILLPVPWGELGHSLNASEAIYTPEHARWPSGYLLRGLEKPEVIRELPSLRVQNELLVLSPRDDQELSDDEVFVVSNMPIDFLYKGRRWHQYSSTAQLMQGLRGGSIEPSPDMRVALHRRFMQPAMDVTLLFLGLPAVIIAQQRRILLAAGKSLLIVAGFSMVVLICHGAGIQAAIDPVLAVWLPLIILIPVAFLISRPLRC